MGSLYQRGGTWWVQYYDHGRRVRESTETEKKTEAKRFLKAREGAVEEGRPILPHVDQILYDEIEEDLRLHYQTTGHRNLQEVDKRLHPLARTFRGWRVSALDEKALDRYVAARQAEGKANGTINRELSLLGTMLRLAMQRKKCRYLPTLTMLKEANARAGFFEPTQYEAVRRHLRPDLRVAVALAYTFGWRVRDEVLTLERRHVDLTAGTIRLDPGGTKNDDGRLVYLTPATAAALAEQLQRVDQLARATGRIIPYVFPNLDKGRLQGQRLRDFRRAWGTASRRAGCPGMLRHDFRRTAVRNLVNDGTPEKVAMLITGHRTRSVFDRYHIVSPEDLRAASGRIATRETPGLDTAATKTATIGVRGGKGAV